MTGTSVSADSRTVAALTRNRVVLWDTVDKVPTSRKLEHEEDVFAVVVSPDGKKVLTTTQKVGGSILWLWDLANGNAPAQRKLHGPQYIMDVAFSPNGKLIAAINDRREVLLWDAASGERIEPSPKSRWIYSWLAFSPNGDTLATGNGSGSIELWDVKTWTPREKRLRLMSAYPVFSPDGSQFLSIDKDRTAQLWDAKTLEPIGQPLAHEGGATCAIFTADGKRAMTAGAASRVVRFWDARSGKPVGQPVVVGEGVSSVAISGDGGTILTAGRQSRLWNAATGWPLCEPIPGPEHPDLLRHSAFEANGQRVITSSMKTTSVWEPPSEVPGTPDDIARWLEVLTGTELDERGSVALLDAASWRERRAAFAATDSPLVLAAQGIALPRQMAAPPGQPRIGRTLTFRQDTFLGRTVDIADYRGKVLLLDFGAAWCSDWRDDMKYLVALHGRHHKHGLDIIGLSLDDENSLAKYLAKSPVPWDVVPLTPWLEYPRNHPLLEQCGIDRLPSRVLIDRQGRVATAPVGVQNLEREVATLLGIEPSTSIDLASSAEDPDAISTPGDIFLSLDLAIRARATTRHFVGEPIVVRYDLANRTGRDLKLTGNAKPAGNQVGSLQHRLERLGVDPAIPPLDATPKQARIGAQYAKGGFRFDVDQTVSSGQVFSMRREFSTTGFPPGKYRYQVVFEYSRTLVKSDFIEFELLPAPPGNVSQASPNPERQDAVYGAIKLSVLTLGGEAHNVGDVLKFQYRFENSSGHAIDVSAEASMPKALTVGIRSNWLIRLGDDPQIGVLGENTYRNGRYAQGGSRILTGPRVGEKALFPYEQALQTTGFPPGRYRFGVDYLTADNKLIQTESVEFELK